LRLQRFGRHAGTEGHSGPHLERQIYSKQEGCAMIEIYYAEDDVSIALSVKEYLERQNCRVSIFGSIADAKNALRNRLPSVLLLDWNMPDGQGRELCRWIRERQPELPIIFLTVRGDSR